MSKEDWVRCYESAKDRGLTETAAIRAAEEGAADIEAQRIDEALENALGNGHADCDCMACLPWTS